MVFFFSFICMLLEMVKMKKCWENSEKKTSPWIANFNKIKPKYFREFNLAGLIRPKCETTLKEIKIFLLLSLK